MTHRGSGLIVVGAPSPTAFSHEPPEAAISSRAPRGARTGSRTSEPPGPDHDGVAHAADHGEGRLLNNSSSAPAPARATAIPTTPADGEHYNAAIYRCSPRSGAVRFGDITV